MTSEALFMGVIVGRAPGARLYIEVSSGKHTHDSVDQPDKLGYFGAVWEDDCLGLR